MEKVYAAKDNMASLDSEVLSMLKDSFIFLGNANVGMVKGRRDNVKSALPKHMQGISSDSVEFSSANLFGDSLNNSIKKRSELNKLSTSLHSRGGFRGRLFRRGRPMRGIGRVFRGSFARWPFRRFSSYGSGKGASKQASNQAGPSK